MLFTDFKDEVTDWFVSGKIEKVIPEPGSDPMIKWLFEDETNCARLFATFEVNDYDLYKLGKIYDDDGSLELVSDETVCKVLGKEEYDRIFNAQSVWQQMDRIRKLMPVEIAESLAGINASAFALAHMMLSTSGKKAMALGEKWDGSAMVKLKNVEKLMLKYCGSLLTFCFIDHAEVCGFHISYDEYLEKKRKKFGEKADRREDAIAVEYAVLKDIERGRREPDRAGKINWMDAAYLVGEYCGVDTLMRVGERLKKTWDKAVANEQPKEV